MELIEIFVSFLNTVANIPYPQIDKIVKSFKLKTVKRNTILLKQGEICENFYFVSKGCIRTFYLTKEGNEKTRHIAFNGSVVTALSSFISQTPSFEFVDSLEKTDLYVINHKAFYHLIIQIPEWEKFYLKLLESAYVLQNKKMEYLVTLSAKQRYELYLNQYPLYVERLSNRILASYLNISQETLSRLKSK
jgi:CRP-like cAMP-binding protein